MKKRYLIIAGILLVIINLSALTTMGYNRYCRYRETCRTREQTGTCGYLCERLALDETQVKTMETARQRFLAAAETHNRELARHRLLLVNELVLENPDTLKIDALCSRIADIQTQLQKQVVRTILSEKTILDPGQRSRYLEIIRSRILSDNEACPPVSSGDAGPECLTQCQQFN